MIDCKELRIGNWVTYNPSSVDDGTDIVPLEVVSIETDYEKGVALSDGFNNVYGFDEILPIPLTPELLEACGFEKGIELQDFNGVYNYYQNGKVQGNFYRNSNTFHPEWDKFATLKHLHQLQNLYFALTQTELTIDIKQIA